MKEVVTGNRYFAVLLAVFTVSQLGAVYLAWNKPLVWDSSVYIGMGKWLFSLGKYGFWENFRPPVLPLLLGALWKLGLPSIGFPRLVSLIISASGLATVYYIASDLFGRTEALLAAGVLAASHTYYFFSLNPLTGIPASILVVAGIYLAEKRRNLVAGLVLGAAFLTRFPAALAGPATVGYIMVRGYQNGDLEHAVKRSAYLTTGFFLLAGPYLLVQQLFNGSFLSPFIRGASITASAGSNYFFGLSYLIEAFYSSPLLALAPVGLYLVIKQREWSYGGFASTLLVFYGFFSLFPLKIERYMLLFLPLMAVLSGRAVLEARNWLEIDREKFLWLSAALLSLVIVFWAVDTASAYNWESPGQQEFFGQVSGINGTVASNDPRVMLYGDFRYVPLPPTYLRETVEQESGKVDSWAINGRYWDCRSSARCVEEVKWFLDRLERNYTKTFETRQGRYNYTIYR